MVQIKAFHELSTLELYEILKVRNEVFVVEQECIYMDIDGKDIDAIHITLIDNSNIAAYLRVLKPGESYKEASIGRVLVAPQARGKGFAKQAMLEAIKFLTDTCHEKHIRISAQEYLKKFYTDLGFETISEPYDEDGIPHIEMLFKAS